MKFLASKFHTPLWFLIFGVILIFIDDVLSFEAIGQLIIFASIVIIFSYIISDFQVKKSKKSNQIGDFNHQKIASFLEKRKIRYIYLPKIDKELTFELPDYNIYIKFWNEDSYSKDKRIKILKSMKSNKFPLIELFPDNLISLERLNWKFTERLLEALKK